MLSNIKLTDDRLASIEKAAREGHALMDRVIFELVEEIRGLRVTIAEGFARGPSGGEKRRLDPRSVGPLVMDLLQRAAPITSAHG